MGSCLRLADTFIKQSFLDSSLHPDSVYNKRQVCVIEAYHNLSSLHWSASPILGEGLEGSAWQRGQPEAVLLEEFVNNPEMQMQRRFLLARDLFAGCLALPVRDVHGRATVGVMMLYMAHGIEDAQGVAAYMDITKNVPLRDFTQQLSDMVGMDCEWIRRLSTMKSSTVALKASANSRARRLWRRLRVLITTGWFRSIDISPHIEPPPQPLSRMQRARIWLENYRDKWRGQPNALPPPRASASAAAWTFIGAFLGLLVPSALHTAVFEDAVQDSHMVMLVGSFAALATLLFGAPASPFAQPRMVVGGHLQAAALAIAMDYLVVSEYTDFSTAFIPQWLAVALVPALAITSMALTGSINPPAAACAFIYIAGDEGIKASGWWYLFAPTLLGCVLMIAVALVVNNLSTNRRYPNFW